MRKKILVLLSALGFVLGIYILQTCQKNVDTIYLKSSYELTGKVISSLTKEPIATAKVSCMGQETVTDINGIYSFTFEDFEDDVVRISAKKKGYTLGTTYFFKENYYSINDIALKSPAIVETIGIQGGEIDTEYELSMDGDQNFEIIFPEGALEEDTDIGITLMFGAAIPDVSPVESLGLVNATTASFSPSGLQLKEPATVKFPLPLILDPGTNLDLLYYNEEELKWERTNSIAVVDKTGTMAIADINHFSIYSIGIKGDFQEDLTSAVISDHSIELDDGYYCYQATVEDPGGTPSFINKKWICSTVCQNSIIGGRVNLSEETCCLVCSDHTVKPTTTETKSLSFTENASSQDCTCPDPGPKPGNCYSLEESYFTCNKEIAEETTLNIIQDGQLTEIKTTRLVTKEVVIQCTKWVPIPNCHEGGSGN